MTARTEAPGRGELAVLGVGVLGVAAMAATGAGVLTVVLLPFLASVVLALLGQATAWLWVLVAMSGIGLSWAEGQVALGAWEINIAGLQWGFTFLLGGLLLVLTPRTGDAWPTPFRWYAAFVGVAVLRLAGAPDLFQGVKHVMEYATPLVVGLVALRAARAPGNAERLEGALWAAFIVSLLAAIASLQWLRLAGDAPGLGAALGNRTYAIFLIPIYALALAGWRQRGLGNALIAAAAFALIVLTLSRTVTAVALVLLGVVFAWRASWQRRIAGVCMLAVVAALAFSFGPLRERMFDPETLRTGRLSEVEVTGEGREARVSLGGISLSGRGLLWLQTWRHARQAPFMGHGTGSSEAYLGRELQIVTTHPHNDYLRVFHDAGALGLAVMLATAAAGLVALRRLALRSTSAAGQKLALAAFLTWLAYLLIAVTDNIVVYVTFFTQNMFLLIALAYIVVEREGRTQVTA